jgi:protein PhnA
MGGYEKNKARSEALNALGRQLARRARSRCELCEQSASLSAHEVPPVPADPELDQTLFVCQTCKDMVQGGTLDDKHLRFIETTIWSDFTPVKVTSYWLLERLHNKGTAWATPLLDNAYITEDEQAWIDAGRD